MAHLDLWAPVGSSDLALEYLVFGQDLSPMEKIKWNGDEPWLNDDLMKGIHEVTSIHSGSLRAWTPPCLFRVECFVLPEWSQACCVDTLALPDMFPCPVLC